MKVDNFLTASEKTAIANAVREAEGRTRGEIKVLVVGSSLPPWTLGSRKKAVRRRALREFEAMGVHKTEDRTGVLIMLSLRERRVEVVADKSIDDKISQETWEQAVEIIVNRVKEKQQAEGIMQAVAFVGGILAKYFPRKADDKNELSDGVEFKE